MKLNLQNRTTLYTVKQRSDSNFGTVQSACDFLSQTLSKCVFKKQESIPPHARGSNRARTEKLTDHLIQECIFHRCYLYSRIFHSCIFHPCDLDAGPTGPPGKCLGITSINSNVGGGALGPRSRHQPGWSVRERGDVGRHVPAGTCAIERRVERVKRLEHVERRRVWVEHLPEERRTAALVRQDDHRLGLAVHERPKRYLAIRALTTKPADVMALCHTWQCDNYNLK